MRRAIVRFMYVEGITMMVYHISVCVVIFSPSVISSLRLLVFVEIDITPFYRRSVPFSVKGFAHRLSPPVLCDVFGFVVTMSSE